MTVSVNAPVMDTYRRWPVTFVSGSGATVFDEDGGAYIDLVAGVAVASVGHAHPRISAAVADQAARLVHVSNLYGTSPQEELAVRLADLTGGMASFFCNSGAEAVEAALKLARKATGRTRFVAAEGGFHGRTFGALAATGQPSKRAAFEPGVPGFTHVPFGDPRALEDALSEEVAAVVLEPIQGEAGVVVPPEGYLALARELCDRAGALLVLDEVQTGLGRTGAWFCYEHEGIVPDVLCVAKALAGGLPMGACLARPAVAAAFTPGDHGSTFGGGPVQSSAALAVLDVIAQENLVDRARAMGERVAKGLRAGQLPLVRDIRGRGLLLGVVLDAPVARAVASAALERGVLVNDVTPDVLRLTPPLVISDDEIDRALSVIREVVHDIAKA